MWIRWNKAYHTGWWSDEDGMDLSTPDNFRCSYTPSPTKAVVFMICSMHKLYVPGRYLEDDPDEYLKPHFVNEHTLQTVDVGDNFVKVEERDE